MSLRMSPGSDEEDEMMIIEINYGKGKKGEILVRYGDEPLALAQQFAKKYKLKQSAESLIKTHIENTVREFLASDGDSVPATQRPGSPAGSPVHHMDEWNLPTGEISAAAAPTAAAPVPVSKAQPAAYERHHSPAPGAHTKSPAAAPMSPLFSPDVQVRVTGVTNDAALTPGQNDLSPIPIPIPIPIPGPGPGPGKPAGSSARDLPPTSTAKEGGRPSKMAPNRHKSVADHSLQGSAYPSHLPAEPHRMSPPAAIEAEALSPLSQEQEQEQEQGQEHRRSMADHTIQGSVYTINTPPSKPLLSTAEGGGDTDAAAEQEQELERSYQQALQEQLQLEEGQFASQQISSSSPPLPKSPALRRSDSSSREVAEEVKRGDTGAATPTAREKAKERLRKLAEQKQQRRQEEEVAQRTTLEAEVAQIKQTLLQRNLALETAKATAAAAEVQSSAAQRNAEAAAEEAERQRLQEKTEHEQWLAEQCMVDATKGAEKLQQTEELYDRMRAATSAKKSYARAPPRQGQGPTARVQDLDMSAISLDTSVFDPSTLKVASSFALTANADNSSVSSASSVFPAHERLYHAAAVRQQNRNNMKSRAEDRQGKYLEENRFSMNDTSRSIMGNVQTVGKKCSGGGNGGAQDILLRLYEDGKREKQKKKELADSKAQAGLEPFRIEEWSCVRCGVFHTIDHNVLQKLQSDVHSSNRIVHSTSVSDKSTAEIAKKARQDAIQAAVTYHSKVFRCSTCGFERPDAVAPHKPLNLALHEAEKNGTAAQLLSRRNQAVESSGGVLEYLRSKHQHVQGQLTRQRKEWDRQDRMLTFQPHINEISHQLVENKILLCKAISGISDENAAGEDRMSTSRKRGSYFGAIPAKNNGTNEPHITNNVTYGNYLSTVTTAGYKNRHGEKTSFPTALSDDPEEEKHRRAEERVQADRAHWLHAHTAHNKKTENSVNYTHDSKKAPVSKYFNYSVTDRLSNNLKPHIVKSKENNTNKYTDQLSEYEKSRAAYRSRSGSASSASQATMSGGGIKDITNAEFVHHGSSNSPAKIRINISDEEDDIGETMEDMQKTEDFVSRQMNWQHKNHAHKERMRHLIHDYDHVTQQPLYRPKVQILEHVQEREEKRGDIVTRLQAKDMEAKRRRAQLVQERLQADEREKLATQVTALPQSKELLAQANERSIREMFTLLLASVAGGDLDNLTLTSMSAGILHDEDCQLDLALVQPTLMVPEVTELLLDVLTEKELTELMQAEEEEKYALEHGTEFNHEANMMVTYEEFRHFVLQCMERRGKEAGYTVLGRSYVYAPRKRTEVATAMVEKELANQTFVPNIGHKSAAIVRQKGRDAQKTPIEKKLLTQGQKQLRDRAQLQKQKQEQEKKENTFKPQLYKAPKGIQPRYRGAAAQPVPPPAPKEPASPPLRSVPKLSERTLAKIAAGASPAVHTARPASTTYGELFRTKSPVRPAQAPAAATHDALTSSPKQKPLPQPLCLPAPPQLPVSRSVVPPTLPEPSLAAATIQAGNAEVQKLRAGAEAKEGADDSGSQESLGASLLNML